MLPTQEGGFGIKDLHRQNRCLLLNFVHSLHLPTPSPGKAGFFPPQVVIWGKHPSPPPFLRRSSTTASPSTAPSQGWRWWTGAPRPFGSTSGHWGPPSHSLPRHLLPLYTPPRHSGDCGRERVRPPASSQSTYNMLTYSE
jgi:hypothetical protein